MVRVDSNDNVGGYVHGGRIGVLVESRAARPSSRGHRDACRGDEPAVHLARARAGRLHREGKGNRARQDVRKEKAKPAEILEKIIGGKVNKIINEITLTGQPYVLDTDESVGRRAEEGRRRGALGASPGGRRRHREAWSRTSRPKS